jgi:hypothetical protein
MLDKTALKFIIAFISVILLSFVVVYLSASLS